MESRTIHLILGCDICATTQESHIFKCFWCVPKIGSPKFCVECMTDHVLEDHPDVHPDQTTI